MGKLIHTVLLKNREQMNTLEIIQKGMFYYQVSDDGGVLQKGRFIVI
jgi:hypothetical protein